MYILVAHALEAATNVKIEAITGQDVSIVSMFVWRLSAAVFGGFADKLVIHEERNRPGITTFRAVTNRVKFVVV